MNLIGALLHFFWALGNWMAHLIAYPFVLLQAKVIEFFLGDDM